MDADVNANDDNNVTPLMLAASSGATDSVQRLIKNGADQTMKDNDGRTALFYAVKHANAMEVLLTGANVNAEDNSNVTPLMLAASFGATDSVKLLIEKGADKTMKDKDGSTALHYAASGGHHRAVAVLLQYGATIERDRSNRTALHEAARIGSKKSVELIVEKRPHCVNYEDDERKTALHFAAVYKHSHLVKLLLANENQDIRLVRDSPNLNILDIAVESNDTEVAETIVEDPRWREGLSSKQMITLVEKMPHVAERLLDHCMQPEGDRFSKDYKIKYDLSLILCEENTEEKAGSLKILKTMAKYRRDKCLTHPLCFIVLSTKWNRFGCTVFLLNLFFFLLLILPLTVMHSYLEENDEIYCEDRIINRTSSGEMIYDLESKSCLFKNAPILKFQVFIIIMIIIHFVKEGFQCYYQRKRYFTAVSLIDLIGLVAAFISVVPPCDCKWGRQKEAASVAIFLSWINLIMYFRRLPFYGKYVIMLYRMFITLFKVLVLFAFFIMAFGTTFYIIIDQAPFTSLPYTLMNIFIMTLGEFNYIDVFMPWNKLYYPGLVNIVMVLFCLSMPIILMNMLVGLAVGDIEKIERNALMDRYIMQVELLIDIEAVLPSRLLKRVHFREMTDYPNKKPSKLYKVYNSLIGFGNRKKGEEEERDERIPEMTQLTEKQEEQASEIEHLQKRVETILELVREQTGILSKPKVLEALEDQIAKKLEKQASEIEHIIQKTMETMLELVREQTDILSKPKVLEASEGSKASPLGKPLDVSGSVASTAMSFESKKSEEKEA